MDITSAQPTSISSEDLGSSIPLKISSWDIVFTWDYCGKQNFMDWLDYKYGLMQWRLRINV